MNKFSIKNKYIVLLIKMKDIQRNLLIINSRDKSSGNSSDFRYNLGDTSLEINAIALKSAAIPHTHTNVSLNNNIIEIETGTDFTLSSADKANYYINGINSYIPVAPGLYSLNTLITELNNNQTFGTFFYDSGLNRVRFTITSAGVNPPGVEFTTGGVVEIIGLLGFTLPITCPAGVGSNILATNAPTYVENVITRTEIPPGQYTALELVTAVASAIDPHIGGTIVGSITPFNLAAFTGATQSWRFNPSPVPELLGWNTDVKTFYTGFVQAAGYFDLYGTRNLYVSSRVLANGYNALQAKGEKSSILGAIPVCSAQGGIDRWESKYLVKKDYPQDINVNSIDIKILDDTGKPVELYGADVVLIFEIWNTIKL
jgi:hypothetical protein